MTISPQVADGLRDRHSLSGCNPAEDAATAARVKAIQELQGWHMLSGDSITVLQDVIGNSLKVPPTTSILHPLYFRSEYYLPKALPRQVCTKQATTIIAIVHHGNPKHWTLVRISTTYGTVGHYDP
ncbi:hypothetical protein ColTof4_01392 [Colletotrichum tofieldiae]|nr:hypothetical protein ColTof3_08646 [Colletotrichum tofieldiae]GKT68969.1 hypothetical protein ColTof4_01392 [Colletotrichum tofieldiae]GKT96831.1 hypothetical protein Ct61P_14681 [Colletotrichum tofieldiae]